MGPKARAARWLSPALLAIAVGVGVAVAGGGGEGGGDVSASGGDSSASAPPASASPVATPPAAPPPAALADATTIYIDAGSELDFVVLAAPRPHRRLGAVALGAIEVVRGTATAGVSPLGEVPAGFPPSGWPDMALAGEGVRRGAAPLAGREEGEEDCGCATDLGDTSAQRIAALWATRSFTVPADRVDDLLILRLRHADGVVIWINGREVARRDVAAAARPVDLAERPHGPEWETFYIGATDGLIHAGDNLLAIEVRPSGRRLAPRLDVELGARSGGAHIVRGPMVQRVGATSAALVFETDLPTKAIVEYGDSDALGAVVASAGGGLARRHVVELVDLPADGAVHYRVIAGDATTPVHVFHTARPAGDLLRVAIYGDVRGGHATHAKLVAAMLDEAPDLVIVTGDLVLRGTDEGDWQKFFTVTGELLAQVPYYPAAGNHDMGKSGDDQRRLGEIFALPPGPADRPSWAHWYAFDVGDVHFIMLDSNAYDSELQRRWLEADLAEARPRARALFAVTHDGPFARGIHGGNASAAADYVPLLVAGGVTLLFAGHEHMYQRGHQGGLDYIISGGGGAPLYPVRCGAPSKHRCKVDDGMQVVAKEFHFLSVTVGVRSVEVCPRRADRTLLEPCLTYSLPLPRPAPTR